MRHIFLLVASTACFAAAVVPPLAPATSYPTRAGYGEPNNTLGAAYGPLARERPYSSYTGAGGDVDWLWLATTGAQDVTVMVVFHGTGVGARCYSPLIATVTNAAGQVLAFKRVEAGTHDALVLSSTGPAVFFVSLAASDGCQETYPYELRLSSSSALAGRSKRCATAIHKLVNAKGRLYSYRRQHGQKRSQRDRRRIAVKIAAQRRHVAALEAIRRTRCRPPQFVLSH